MSDTRAKKLLDFQRQLNDSKKADLNTIPLELRLGSSRVLESSCHNPEENKYEILEKRVDELFPLVSLRSDVESLRHSIDEIMSLRDQVHELSEKLDSHQTSSSSEVSEYSNSISELRSLLRKYKDDSDRLVMKVDKLTDSTSSIFKKVTDLSNTSVENLSTDSNLSGRLSIIESSTLPSILTKISEFQGRVDVIKRILDSNQLSVKEQIQNLSTQMNSITGGNIAAFDDLNEAISHINIVLSDMGSRIDKLPFGQQILKVIEMLKQSNSTISILRKDVTSSNDSVNLLHDSLESLKSLIHANKSDSDSSIADINHNLDRLISQFNSFKSDGTTLNASLVESIQKLSSGFVSHQSSITSLENQGLLTNGIFEDLVEQISHLKSKGDVSDNQQKETSSEIVSLKGLINDIKAKLTKHASDSTASDSKLTSRLDITDSKISDIKGTSESANNLAQYLAELYKQMQSDITTNLSRTDLLSSNISDMEIKLGSYSDFHTRLGSVEDSNKTVIEKIKSLLSEQGKIAENQNGFNSLLQQLQETYDKLPSNRKFGDIQIDIANLQSVIKTIKSEQDSSTQYVAQIPSMNDDITLLKDFRNSYTSDKDKSTTFQSATNSELLKIRQLLDKMPSKTDYDSLSSMMSDSQRQTDSLIDTLTKRLAYLEQDEGSDNTQIKSLKDLITSTNSQTQSFIAELQQNNDNSTSHTRDLISKLQAQINQMSNSEGSSNEQLNQTQTTLSKLTSQFDGLKISHTQQNDQLNQQQSLLSKLTSQFDVLKTSQTEHGDQLNQTQTLLSKMSAQLASQSASQDESLNQTQSLLSKLQIKLNEIKNGQDDHADQLNQQQSKFSKITSFINDLKEQLDQMNHSAGSTSESQITDLKSQIDEFKTQLHNSNSSTSQSIQLVQSQITQLSSKLTDHLTESDTNSESMSKLFGEMQSQISILQSKQDDDTVNNDKYTELSERINALSLPHDTSTFSGSMRWLPSFNALTGTRDPIFTSIQDSNSNSQLMMANYTSFIKGLRSYGKSEIDSLKIGYHNSQPGPILDMKGDVVLNGKINGKVPDDLGRSAKLSQSLQVEAGKAYTIAYNGEFPNRVKILLDGVCEVPLSSTDGYIYSYSLGTFTLKCGSNSVGYQLIGSTLTPKKSGSYTILLY